MFEESSVSVRAGRRLFTFRYRSPGHFLDVFKSYYGPMLKAFEALHEVDQFDLRADILGLVAKLNTADDGTMVVPSEYLEIVIVKR